MPEISPASPADDDRFAIVVAQWNADVTEKLLQGALETFASAGVGSDRVDVARVPGSWELPLVAQRFARSGQYAAVICLGAVIQGETTHDEHINRTVCLAMSDIALASDVPVLLGLLTCYTMQQALDRSGGRVGNKGSECAEASLQMVGLLKRLPQV